MHLDLFIIHLYKFKVFQHDKKKKNQKKAAAAWEDWGICL